MHAHAGVHVCEKEEASKNIFVILPQQYCVDLDLPLAPKRKTEFGTCRIQTDRR